MLYPHQFSWGQIRSFLSEGESPIVPELSALMTTPASRALAFDTWVDQTDHNDHPSNIVFGYEGSDYRSGLFIFLDYAFSMGVAGTWKNEGYRTCRPAPFPPRMCGSLSTALLHQAIAGIEALPDALVSDIVHRVPWQWLSDDEKQLVLAGLLGRRRLVRTALQGYLEGTL